MLLTSLSIFLVMTFLFRPLQKNGFYILHAGIVILLSLYTENYRFRISPFTSNAFIYVYIYHLIVINFVTFIAYFFDKRAAKKGKMRVSERSLHALEFLGGVIGAFLGQRIFNHKTKKKDYRAVFIFLCFVQVGILFVIVKYLI